MSAILDKNSEILKKDFLVVLVVSTISPLYECIQALIKTDDECMSALKDDAFGSEDCGKSPASPL